MTTSPTLARKLLPKLLLGSALLLSSGQAVSDGEGTLNLYLNGGYYWFDDQRLDGTPYFGFELEDRAGGGIGFGYNVTDRWALEGVYNYFSVNVQDTFEDVEVQNYHVDLLYQFAGRFCGNYDWQPYVVAGIGELRIDEDTYGYPFDWHRRQTMVNFGMGVKYRLHPRWQVRGDARGFQGVEESGLDAYVSMSIGYQWGEDPVAIYDRDGDGVYDDADECPQTPPGIDVDFRGCPIDTDGDGVPDYLDLCPNTPMGMAVNEDGCPREGYDPYEMSK
ncbi:outer membrane beta-barrel protein [Microbulbifer agarilyticus]|uniref:outer membrane beta-barrel protein n=1 Tax=Microbulbifer agarilyticus TaxID=260552 RepID=UPI001C985CAC|nr:outer membrane beta-barrel protein [Microbulbifer agarilyticus]MBY6190966.1 outer membrane beta-barrel protein [Microbulbifer agarilyticus]